MITRSESETEALARELAAELGPDDVVSLIGDLGAGKTTFARGMAAGLGLRRTVLRVCPWHPQNDLHDG